jgi:hypothetical protein
LSPFCRRCLGVARPGEARCPLDQEFYLRRDCPSCGREVFPREQHCAHCAARLEEAPETLLLPVEAARWGVLSALGLDLLGVSVVVAAQFWGLPLVWSLPLGVLIGLLYRALSRAGGRQSFGQAVFHHLTVDRQAGRASYRSSFLRTFAEAPYLALSLFQGARALSTLDEISGSYEVRLD